mmetsp:Transcript_17200/g.15208  ORF Transcript_17200/g.15208 Transcript_17200/m.15208 type:complete len:107 (+) Transcript_17200:407-727(+)
MNSSTGENQNIRNVQLMANFNNVNPNMYLMNNPCGKINQLNQLNCNQTLISLSQNLPNRNYQFFQTSAAPLRIIRGQVMPQYDPNASLPKLSMVMMPNRMSCQFNN